MNQTEIKRPVIGSNPMETDGYSEHDGNIYKEGGDI